MKRSSAMIRSAFRKLCNNRRERRRATEEFSRNHPAAIASSGFKSMDQKTRCFDLRGTARAATKESSGGEVRVTITSTRGESKRRNVQLAMKLAKSTALRHFAPLPIAVQLTRSILTLFQVWRRGKTEEG